MNTIITADQIQQGDRIKVTTDESGEHRKVLYSYEGVAARQDGEVWRTECGGNLWVHERGAVIELLDRPKPKIVLPTGEHAVIQYRRGTLLWTGRFNGKNWKLKNDCMNFVHIFSASELTDMLNDGDKPFVPRTGYKVLFEGVAK